MDDGYHHIIDFDIFKCTIYTVIVRSIENRSLSGTRKLKEYQVKRATHGLFKWVYH